MTVTVKPPTDYQLLGMVLKDDASNSISAGNNKLTFETRMANYYKTGRSINDNVTFTVSILATSCDDLAFKQLCNFYSPKCVNW